MAFLEISDHVVNSLHLRAGFERVVGAVIAPPIPTTVRVRRSKILSDGEGVQAEEEDEFLGGNKDNLHHHVVSLGPLVVASVLYKGSSNVGKGHLAAMESNVNSAITLSCELQEQGRQTIPLQ